MTDEHEPVRFSREVWDDFAAGAARCGFLSLPMLLMLGSSELTTVGDELTLVAVGGGGLLIAFAIHLVVSFFSTRYRHQGVLPVAATVVFVSAVATIQTREFGNWLVVLFAAGLLGVLSTIRPQLLPDSSKGSPAEVVRRRFHRTHTVAFTAVALTQNAVPFAILLSYGGKGAPAELAVAALWYVFALTATLCVFCWLRFVRPFVEFVLDPVVRLLYRVRVKGPGLKALPGFGPCLVIANHAFWFDPCVLGFVLPRPITPVMTASFYRIWFLRPLLKYVFRVIVVPETAMKRDLPEVEGAIAALDRGEVVVVFPEGYLRRKEETPLRRFGQGVARVLAARPHTPVVACWIEGGWGSKFSYKNGPPAWKGKPMDFRRPIDVGLSSPETVPAEVLADQIGTRLHLMNRVAAARTHLGLPPLPAFDLPTADSRHEEPA